MEKPRFLKINKNEDDKNLFIRKGQSLKSIKNHRKSK